MNIEDLTIEVDMDQLNEHDKEYERWKSRLLLQCFSPYRIEERGYLINYMPDGGDRVIVEYVDEYEGVIDEYIIALDEFISEERPYVSTKEPLDYEIVDRWIEYNGEM